MLRVPVLSKSGKPLMPTKPSRARRWLREGFAKVVHNDLECFAIQLTFETGENTQPIAIGIDPGKRYSGVGVQSGFFTLWMAHLVLPFKTVKERMELRRVMRRARRGRRINRKLPYSERCHRPARFDNRKSDNAKHGGWCGNAQITPAPFAVIRRPPISRRQLHLCVPSKGGKRRKYGGTVTRHGFRKGDKVIAQKAGKTYTGWCSGDTDRQVSVSDVYRRPGGASLQRLGQFTAKKVQLLQRSTGLIVVPSTGPFKSPLIERVDLTAIPLHPASLRVESRANTMTLLTFLLGLALGIGFGLWLQHRTKQQLKQTLELLPANSTSNSFPLESRLRGAIAQANQQRLVLEDQLNAIQALFQVAPIGYLQVDEDNHLTWCNQQARELLQIDRWEPGQIRLLLEVVRSYELDQLIEKTRKQQQSTNQEWVFHPACMDGAAMSEVRSRTLRAYGFPLTKGQVGVFLENRQPLVELSESRNQWVSDLAHELRTPLTSIRLVAEALQGRVNPPESRWVNQLLQEINRLIDLLQNWLELSHLEQDPNKSLTYKSLDLNALIQSAWQRLEPLAEQKHLHLDYKGPDTLTIRADESRLIQVFLNLLDNSIKHSPPHGSIRVEVTTSPPSETSEKALMQIDIIDEGAGFSGNDLPRVFERLYRGDASRYRQPTANNVATLGRSSGSGLGLAIVQQIVQAHGGTVNAQNHPETGGAWLQIQLPYQ